MNPWLETIAVFVLAVAAGFAAVRLSRLPIRYWLAAYVAPLLVLCAVGAAMWSEVLSFIAPFSWLTAGRVEFVVIAVCCTMLLVLPLRRLRGKSPKFLTVVLCVVCVVYFGILPFLIPALLHDHLLGLKTTLDRDGICLQSNAYTCGPAAAVTALRLLGLPAEEGELAVLARTGPLTGTPPDILAAALRKRYGGDGLSCDYRLFESISELHGAGLTIAIVKYDFFRDHYVVVLDASDERIVLGDPLCGTQWLTNDQFKDMWRFSGLVLKRDRSS